MVKIRLRRVGAKKQPHYRVVVADSHAPRDGRFIETIGHYNPRTEPPTVEIDTERVLHWLGVGAQPTEAVRRMLDKLGIIARHEALKRGEVPVEEVEAEPDLLPEALEEETPEEEEEGDQDLDLEEEDDDEEEEEDEELDEEPEEEWAPEEEDEWAPDELFDEESEEEAEESADLDVEEGDDVDED
jgi:small subunit ribosomal protein S16